MCGAPPFALVPVRGGARVRCCGPFWLVSPVYNSVYNWFLFLWVLGCLFFGFFVFVCVGCVFVCFCVCWVCFLCVCWVCFCGCCALGVFLCGVVLHVRVIL